MNCLRVQVQTLHLIALTSLIYLSGYSYKEDILIMTSRSSTYPILDVILHRWSSYAMSGEALSHKELMTVLEAGRWAPSSYNNQPWHFIYGIHGTPAWDTLFSLLVPFNQSWCANGSVLVCVVSAKNFIKTGKPSRTHLFDTGSAWENIALQAISMGLVCHGIEGFDYAQAQIALQIPDSHEVVMMFVLGKPAPVSALPAELAKRQTPSDRVPLDQLISEGKFENKRK